MISATHERTVQLIKNSGDTLVMKVVTARSRSHGNYDAHMDGTRTLPVPRRGNLTTAVEIKQTGFDWWTLVWSSYITEEIWSEVIY